MKKIFLSLIVSITIFSSAISQTVIKSFANQSATWSDYYGEWIYGDVNNVQINFLLQQNVIIARDRASSTYTTFDIIEQNDNYSAWEAIDNKGENCVVHIGLLNGYKVLMIMYQDYLIRYYY